LDVPLSAESLRQCKGGLARNDPATLRRSLEHYCDDRYTNWRLSCLST
jgi:hypothetical protein